MSVEFAPDSVPDVLADRDQWVAWHVACRECYSNYELEEDKTDCRRAGCDGGVSKVPVNPHTGNNASSNDPDTWATFDDALEYHRDESTHTHGVGFMFSREGMVVGIDLDNVRDPGTGDLEPWAEEIVNDVDSWTEVSASGTGLHIYALGFKPGDRCKRKQKSTLERFDTAEVEMYDGSTSRYFAVTGEHLEGTPEVIEQRNDTVQAVYEEYLADDTDDGQNTPPDDTASEPVDLDDRELIEKAKNAENGGKFRRLWRGDIGGYDKDHSSARMALLCLLAYWTGGDEKRMDRLFRDSGLYPHPDKAGKWDRVGDDEIRKATRYTDEYYTPGDRSDPPDPDTDAKEIARREKLKDLLTSAEAVEEPDPETLQSIRQLVANVEEVDGDLRGRVTETLDWSGTRLERHRDLSQHADKYGRIQVQDGSTFFIQQGKDGAYREQVLNFELDVDSILKIDNREVIEANLHRPSGSTDAVQFEPRDMQKKQRFKDNVLAGKFGLTFDPPSKQSETVLNALNEYIGRLDVPVRTGTHHIGLHGDEWVTPNGSLTADGWADDPDAIYVERNVALERAVNLPTDVEEHDTTDVQEVVTALPKTRDTSRMLAVLGWFYAAPLRPYIFDEWGAGAFNHLNITGDTGSGKTTTLRYLWRAFGVESDPFAVTDTKFAMLSALSASNGLPVWYDEYKPSEIQDYRLDQFHDLYRKAATGGTATRGRADQTTEEYHTHAPVVVSGEEQIRRPAERRRSIMVAFREDVTDKGTDTRSAFKSLVGEGRIEDGELVLPDHAPDPTHHALAYYRWIAGVDAADLRAKWQDARELVWDRRRAWDGDYDLDDMEVQGLQTVAFGWMVMREFAKEHGVDLSELPGEEQLDESLQHVAGEIGPDGQRKSHMDRFVELFERAAAAEYVERGQHYDIVHEGKTGREQLRLHLSRVYDALSKYARDHGLDNEELLSNPDDYLKRFKEAADSNDTYVVTHSQFTPGLGRCVGIQTVAAMTQLEFDRSVVADGSVDGPSAKADAQNSGQQAATDGGDVPEDATGKVVHYIKNECSGGDILTVASVAGATGLDPSTAEDAIDTVRAKKGLLGPGEDEWQVLE